MVLPMAQQVEVLILNDGGDDSGGGGDSSRATLMELTSLRLPYNKLCKPININTGWVLDFRLITI